MIILFESIIILLLIYEQKKFRTIVTPFFMLAGIYVLCIPINNYFCTLFGLFRIKDITIFWNLLFLIVLFVSGSVTRMILNIEEIPINDIEEKVLSKQKKIMSLFLISGVCYWINLFQVIARYGINNTKGNAFGVFAHIGFISRCLLPIIFWYFLKTKKIKYIFSYIIVVLGLIIFRGKYHLFIPVVGTVLVYILYNKKLTIGKIIKYAVRIFIIAMLLFVLVYTIIPNLINGITDAKLMKRGIAFSIEHFLHYLFCPFIASNEYYCMPEYNGMSTGLLTAFNAFNTLFQQFIGNRSFHDPALGVAPIVNSNGTTANVGGLFSELVFGIGMVGAVLYVFVVGLITYFFFYQLIKKKKMIITSLYMLSLITLSFFCNFYSIFANLECFVYCMLLDYFIIDNTFIIRK